MGEPVCGASLRLSPSLSRLSPRLSHLQPDAGEVLLLFPMFGGGTVPMFTYTFCYSPAPNSPLQPLPRASGMSSAVAVSVNVRELLKPLLESRGHGRAQGT